MSSRIVIRESLELLLRKISKEMVIVESRLHRMARKLGLDSWEELEKLFTSSNINNPEIDMMWPEYLYLRDRLKELKSIEKRF